MSWFCPICPTRGALASFLAWGRNVRIRISPEPRPNCPSFDPLPSLDDFPPALVVNPYYMDAMMQLCSVQSLRVGAALIKKYSIYRTNQKKVPRVFSQKLVLGDPKPLPNRWQTLLPSSPILSTSTSSKINPLGIECLSFICQARDSGSTVARGQHFLVRLWRQNRESCFPRGKNYATPSKIQ
jgi:hypothetical protein